SASCNINFPKKVLLRPCLVLAPFIFSCRLLSPLSSTCCWKAKSASGRLKLANEQTLHHSSATIWYQDLPVDRQPKQHSFFLKTDINTRSIHQRSFSYEGLPL